MTHTQNKLGKNVKIWNPCNIYNCRIGQDVQIGAFSDIGGTIIGDGCRIGASVTIPDGTLIAHDVFIGPNTSICNDVFPTAETARLGKGVPLRVIIENGASIGANCTILPGVRIGKYALIGGGSVVTKDVPPNEIWIGNPAKRLRKK